MARSGATSSSQVKAKMPSAAGQSPTQAGNVKRPFEAGWRIALLSNRWSVRSGLSVRQTGPSSSEIGTSPTQTRM